MSSLFNYTMPVRKSFELDNSDAAFMAEAARTVIGKGLEFKFETEDGCVNVTCNASDEWEPVCLIGTILVNMGVPAEWFEATNTGSRDAHYVMNTLGFSTRITTAARAAQRVQDNRGTWGDALKMLTISYVTDRDATWDEENNGSSDY